MNTKEIDRLIDDIAHAVKSSSLLPLLRQRQQQHRHRRNTQCATTVKIGTTEEAADAAATDTYVSQATLDEQLLLIRQVLERIDPHTLLDLELLDRPSAAAASKQQQRTIHHNARVEHDQFFVPAPKIKEGYVMSYNTTVFFFFLPLILSSSSDSMFISLICFPFFRSLFLSVLLLLRTLFGPIDRGILQVFIVALFVIKYGRNYI